MNEFEISAQNVDEYNRKVKEFADKMSLEFDKISKNSVKSMRETADAVENFLELLSNGNLDAAGNLLPNLSSEQISGLAESQEKLRKIREELGKVREAADDSATGFGRMGVGIKKMFASASTAKDFQKGLSMLSEGFDSILNLSDKFAGSLRNIGEIAGSGALTAVADGLSGTVDMLGSAMSGAKAGAAFGPIGAAIGGAVGLLAEGTKKIAENKKHLEMLYKQAEENRKKEFLAEVEMSRLQRERHDWAMESGESNLDYLMRQGKELQKMRIANENDQKGLLAELHKMEFKQSASEVKKTGLFGLGKGKTIEKWESLAGKTYEDIALLAESGKLSQEGKDFYEALKQSREEGEALYDGLVNAIADGFADGKRSAADFADTFEEIMRATMMDEFKNHIRKSLQDALSIEGLFDDKELFNAKMEELSSGLQTVVNNLEEKNGISLFNKKSNGPDQKKIYQEFNDYILAEEHKLEKERVALMENSRERRLQESRLEFEEKERLLQEEYQGQLKNIKQLNAKQREAALERLDILNEEQKEANRIARETRDEAIKNETIQKVEDYKEEFTAFKLTNEQKRQKNIRKSFEEKQNEMKSVQGSIYANEYLNLLSMAGDAEDAELMGPILDKFQSSEKKREEIIEYYKEILKLLEEANNKKGGLYEGKLDEVIEQVKKQEITDLASHDSNTKGYSDVVSKLFESDSKQTLKSMREMEKELEKFWDALSGKDLEKAGSLFPEFSMEQLKDLAGSEDGMQKLRQRMDELHESANALEPAFNKMGIGLKKLFNSKGDSKKFEEGLAGLSQGLGEVTTYGNMFAGALGNIGELTGSGALGNIAEGMGTAFELAGSAMQGAQAGMAVGGPVGAIVGAGVSLVSSTAKIFSENKKHRQMLKQQLKDNEEKNYFAELDINRLYRERYEWAQKIGEATIRHLERQGEELKKQSSANAKEQDELWAKLMGTEYISNERFKKTGLFGKGKGKIVQEWSSLSGKSWEEIERLAASNKLSEEGMKYYEALKKAREEGEDLAKRQEEYLEQVRQVFTGTTYDSLVDTLVGGFKEGKRSAEDFADTFEKLMKSSVTSALKLFMDDSLREWYEKWAEMSEAGLTEADIIKLQGEYNKLIEEGDRKLQELETITGITLADPEAYTQNATKKSFAAMSQDTGDELNGRFTALQMSGIHLEQSALVRNEMLGNLQLDTAAMRTNIGLVGMSVDEIRDINRQSMNHLYKIEKNTALLNSTNELLGKVVSNTANL